MIRQNTGQQWVEDVSHDIKARLAAETDALARLNEASSRLWRLQDLREGLDEMLAATLDLLGAEMGNVQLLDVERGVLTVAAQRGFDRDFLEFFRELSANDHSACGRTSRTGERTVIEDVETDLLYAPLRAIARAAGYRAVQATPLIGRGGARLGILSTHFRSPHRPSETDLRRLDLYARQAADFIERCRADEALRGAAELEAFRVRLADALRPLSDPAAIRAEAGRQLGQWLGANHVAYFEERGGNSVVEPDIAGEAEPPEAGYPLAPFGERLLTLFRGGRILWSCDVAADAELSPDERAAFAAFQVGAYVAVPLFQNGGLAAGLAIHSRAPRVWTADDIALIEETAGRTWTAIESARAETALHETREQQAFLLKLSDILRPLADPLAIQETAARLLGETLGVSRALYVEIKEDQRVREYIVERNYLAPGVDTPVIGRFSMADYGESLVAAGQAGVTIAVRNIETEPRLSATERNAYVTLGIKAHITTPLIKKGRWIASVSIHQLHPRAWTRAEIALVEEVAERTWAAVERARAEKALADSEEKYRTLFASIDEGFCTIEVLFDGQGRAVDYRFLETNPAFLRQTGLENAVSRTVRELLPEHEDFWIEMYGRIAESGEGMRVEHESSALGRFYDVYAFRIGSPGEHHVAVIFNDISERRRAESTLRWSARRDELLSHTAARLLESTDPQILVEDLCRQVMAFLDCQVFFNFLADPQAKRLRLNACAGIPAEEAIEIQWLDYGVAVCGCVARDRQRIVAEDISNAPDPRTDLIKTYGIQAYCCHPLMVEGRLIGTLSFGTRTRAHFGPDEIAVMKGVTDLVAIAMHRIETERALRESEERFADFMRRLPGLAWIKDTQGRYVYVNDAAERAFQHPRTALYGKTDDEIFPPETAAQFRANDCKALDTGTGLVTIETLKQDDGIVHHSVVSKFPLRDAEGRVNGTGGVAIDVSERVRAEQQLQDATEKLREADRRKDEFLATLAHELRNPLAPIRNALQVFRKTVDPHPSTDRLLDMMNRQMTHLVRLVDDLLEVSRITRGKIALRKERVDIADIVGQAVETSRPLIEASRHSLEMSLPPEPLWVEADPVRLTQVLANLLNNAAKYMEAGGSIRVAAERDGDTIVVRVRDKGVGISADVLPYVFDLFAQADRSLDRSQGGLGIGLALVRRLVEMHGGTATADSPGPGRGSEFAVHLPAAP